LATPSRRSVEDRAECVDAAERADHAKRLGSADDIGSDRADAVAGDRAVRLGQMAPKARPGRWGRRS
jgi:hypothetical protein